MSAATIPTVYRKLAREHARKRHYKKALREIVAYPTTIDTDPAVALAEVRRIAREALA